MKKKIFVFMILCLSLCMFPINKSICNAQVKEIQSNNIKKYIDEEKPFIAYYDVDKDTTNIYTGTDINEISNRGKCNIVHREPKYPTNKLLGSIGMLREGQIRNSIINYSNEDGGATIIGSDDRVVVEANKRYTMPVCATADLTIWHKDGSVSSATAFELGDRLLATAGHVLINKNGSFPRGARAQFGYINGISVRRYDEDSIAGYIYVGGATGNNFNSDNDYGFIVWKEGISDYVGYYGIDYSYGINTPCETYGYPSGFNGNMIYCSGYVTDKYYCTIETSLDSSYGQSGSPIFTQGGYAIGILHGGNGEATFGRQLETGLTSWLNDNGYFD